MPPQEAELYREYARQAGLEAQTRSSLVAPIIPSLVYIALFNKFLSLQVSGKKVA
jgi:hypothetical protein